MGAGANYSKGGGGGSGLDTRGGEINNKDRLNNKSNENLLEKLLKEKVKINIKETLFIAKDKSGQIVWLEQGNRLTGLKHIVSKHQQDFVKKHNIQPKHLVSHLKNIIVKGKILSSKKVVLPNGKIGLEKQYSYKGKYYTLAAIGTNGYIISMYPKRKEK